MSDRVVDECNPDAHLTIKDVSTLCFDDKKDEGEIKDWSFCKDKYIDIVLQKVLEDHGTTLTKEPFQHESLLVDRKEKQLSQQEKRLAKKGYEREKNAARQPSYLSGSGRGNIHLQSLIFFCYILFFRTSTSGLSSANATRRRTPIKVDTS